jgi:hypothetical protein
MTLYIYLFAVGVSSRIDNLSISVLLIMGYFVDNYLRFGSDSARAAPHVGSSERLDIFKLVPADVGQLKGPMASVLNSFASNIQS